MEDVKAIKNASGRTVNDIVVAAPRARLKHPKRVGDPSATKKLPRRAATPVRLRRALRAADQQLDLSLALPMGVMSAAERLRRAQKTCNLRNGRLNRTSRALNVSSTPVQARKSSQPTSTAWCSRTCRDRPSPSSSWDLACERSYSRVQSREPGERAELRGTTSPDARRRSEAPRGGCHRRAAVKEIDALRESATASSSM